MICDTAYSYTRLVVRITSTETSYFDGRLLIRTLLLSYGVNFVIQGDALILERSNPINVLRDWLLSSHFYVSHLAFLLINRCL